MCVGCVCGVGSVVYGAWGVVVCVCGDLEWKEVKQGSGRKALSVLAGRGGS